jgi:two-component system, cell cycle sensor histidine kinase and response regulator CckA
MEDASGKTGIAPADELASACADLAAALEREARNRAFLEGLSEGVGIIDETGVVVEWNAANARIFGVCREDAIGTRFSGMMMRLVPRERRAPERVAQIERMIREAFRTGVLGVPLSGEHDYERPDGSRGTLSLAVFPIPTARGFCFAMVTRDVTERKEAERELAFREEKLSAVFQSSYDIIAILNGRGEIEHLSVAAERILKRPLEELIGMNVFEMVHPDDLGKIRADFANVLVRKTDEIPTAARFRTGAGDYAVLELLGNPVDVPGQEMHAVIVARDATQRLKADEEKDRLKQQLLHAQKMESIGRLAGGIAHDFNNLLTGIISNASLALLDVGPADPLHPLLYDIATAANSAAGLTRQLLAFSRRQIIEPRVISPGELVANMRRMIERIVGEDIRLETELPSDLGNIKVDPSQVEQIIVNLAVNARDAMPNGGVLRLAMANAARPEHVRDDGVRIPAGPFLCLEVADTGCGMTDDARAHLFEPFFTTKPVGMGTGLGLATVYGAVQQNGGAIEVETEVGRGTSFRMFFPRVELPAEARARPLAEILPTGDETVLLVEDDNVARAVALRVLERLGYRVIACADGEEALRVAQNEKTHIDLLMTDVVMPGLSGRELAAQLARIRPELKVLYASGFAEDVVIRDGVLEAGIEFLAKPYTLQTVAQKLRQVLDRR